MKKDKPLVSVITPCYNGEKTIKRQMDSIIQQTYRPIEYILINDGSTDSTEKIVKQYEKKFKDANIDLKYIYQENKGLGGAINTGIKLFTGDYLCWPDADDYLEHDSIEKRVAFLEKHPDFGVVSSDASIYNSDDLSKCIGFVSGKREDRFNENQFELLLKEQSIFCPGCHMVRTQALLDVNPNRDIYEARRGQNWQILLPIYYKYKRGFIDEPLYNYIVYPVSMSHEEESLEKELFRADEHETIIINTLNRINMNNSERHYYIDFIKERYIRKRFNIYCKYGEKNLLNKEFDKLKQLGKCTKEDLNCKLSNNYKIYGIILKIVNRLRRFINGQDN